MLFELLLQRWISTMTRALIFLGPMVLVFWILKPKWIQKFRIPQLREVKPIFKKELPRSVVGLSVYLIPFTAIVLLQKGFGYTRMYTDIETYGLPYFIFSIFLFIFILDAGFYWSHRWMHQNAFLRKSHAIHHQSINVTPTTAYSFHWIEAILTMLPYMFIVLVLPWHPIALLIFASFGILFNGYLHLGYDFAYKTRMKYKFLSWLNTSTHHSVHHQTYESNYGLYFTFWDRWMKTEVSDKVLKR